MNRSAKFALVLFGVIALTGCSKSTLPDTEAVGQNIGENKNSHVTKYDQKAQEKRKNEALGGTKQETKQTQPKQPPKVKKPTMEIKEITELAALDYKENYKGVEIQTNLGTIEVELYTDESPATTNNFMQLAHEGFYDSIKFHRIIADFMIQGGDPNSKDDNSPETWGTGGPGYLFPDEINTKKLVRGSLAMANSGPNTNGSQFFIVTKEETSWLDGMHTNFGFVTKGMDVVEKIEAVPTGPTDRPLDPVIIEKMTLIEK